MYFDQCSGIAHRRAAQRVDVVQRRDDVLGHPQRLHVGDVGVHLPRRFGVRRVLEHHPHAIDLELLDRPCRRSGGRDQPGGAGRHALAEALADIAMRAGRQQQAVLVEQPPVHGVAGIDVLGDREVHEVDGRDDGNLPRPHVRFIDDAAHAAPMVAMGVGIDHGRDGQALADMLLEQFPRGAHRLRGHQRVEDDPAGLAPDEGDVGEVETADLVDAGDDLVEPVVVVQLGLAEQRGMDAVEFVLLIQELEPLHVPGDMAGIGHDLQVLHRSDEALLLLLEVPLVGKWQGRLGFVQNLQREL